MRCFSSDSTCARLKLLLLLDELLREKKYNNKVLAFQVIIMPIPILEEDEDVVVFSLTQFI